MLSIFIFTLALTAHAQTIKWAEGDRLTWSDFKGRPNDNSPYFALTQAGITYSYTVNYSDNNYALDFKIGCEFDKRLSWSIKEKQTPTLLQHEQLHFDINELFARKLAAILKAKTYSANYKQEVSEVFAGIIDQIKEMQEKYDIETRHSMNREKQAEWEAVVKNEISKLPSYR